MYFAEVENLDVYLILLAIFIEFGVSHCISTQKFYNCSVKTVQIKLYKISQSRN